MKVRKTGFNQGKPGIPYVDQVNTWCKPVGPQKWCRKIRKTDKNQVFTWSKVAEISGPSATKNQVFTRYLTRYFPGKATKTRHSPGFPTKNQVKCRKTRFFPAGFRRGSDDGKTWGKPGFFRPDPSLVLSDRKTPGFFAAFRANWI